MVAANTSQWADVDADRYDHVNIVRPGTPDDEFLASRSSSFESGFDAGLLSEQEADACAATINDRNSVRRSEVSMFV